MHSNINRKIIELTMCLTWPVNAACATLPLKIRVEIASLDY